MDVPAPADPPPEQSSKEAAAAVLREVAGLVKATSELARFVDTKTNAALIIFGGAVILIGLGMMFHITNYRLLTPSEFFAVIILGLALIVLGAFKRVVQIREVTTAQENTLQKAADITETLDGRGKMPR